MFLKIGYQVASYVSEPHLIIVKRISISCRNIILQVHYKIKDNGKWNSNDVPQPRNNRRIAREISFPKNYKLANLLPVTTYQIKVSAYNTEGSTDSNIKEIKTDESGKMFVINQSYMGQLMISF